MLLRIGQLNNYREKNYRGLRWKSLEALLIAITFGLERCRILALEIFRLVLCLSIARIISLELINLFVEYENTKIDHLATILTETIISLNHYRKNRKGFMRCFASLLFIWFVNLIKTETLVFRDLWWFDQNPFDLFVSKKWQNIFLE